MSVTLKKVILQTRDGDSLAGFLDPLRLDGQAEIELLSPEGQRRTLPSANIDVIFHVQDFDVSVPPRRSSTLAPHGPGLWVRLRLRDRESIEAIAPNDLLAWRGDGFEVEPLTTSGGCSRIWIPRHALESVQVLAVLSAPVRRAPAASPRKRPARSARDQISLFTGTSDSE